jgi:hypothetical protein
LCVITSCNSFTDTSHHYSDVTYTESDKEAFKGISVHDILLTGLSGSFQTPNYPTADHRLDCIWLIRVKPPNTVRLVMMDFDTERDFDFIFVSHELSHLLCIL